MSTDELAQSWAAHPVPSRRTSAPRQTGFPTSSRDLRTSVLGLALCRLCANLVWTGLDWQVFGSLVCVSCLSTYGDGDAAAWTKQDGSFDRCRWCIDATQYNMLQRKPAAWMH